MFGKGALIFVVGLGVIFASYQAKLNRLMVRAGDNFNYHYVHHMVHEASTSAMNFGINEVWANDTDSLDIDVVMPPCTSLVQIRPIGLDTIRVTVNSRTRLFVDEYYSQHGDLFPVQDSMFAIFDYYVPLNRYFWFTNFEQMSSGTPIYWTSNDTMWGPMHTNGTLRTSGSPVFYGKATARNGIDPDPTTSSANFYGGYEVGIDASIPTDMSIITDAANMDGAAINQKARYDTKLWLEFLPNGKVIRAVENTSTWPTDPADLDTFDVSYLAPHGVITSTEDIHIKGTLNGAVTLYASDTYSDIHIEDDIVYADDPNTNPNSDDILGLVARDDIWITDNTANSDGVDIQAALMSITGSFGAENYASRAAAPDPLQVMGSIIQDRRGPVGTFNSSTQTIVSGFAKRYRYDPRFSSMNPPRFPFIRELQLVSWWE